MLTLFLGLWACTPSDDASEDSAPPVDAEPVEVTDVELAVHDDVATLLVVSWSQDAEAQSWLEFDVGDGVWQLSPATLREAGEHEEVILGVPAETDVTFRVVTEHEGVSFVSDAQVGTTGELPEILAEPLVGAYDAAAVGPERWVLGSIDADGGEPTYAGPWWLFIADRAGRIVWYHELGGGEQSMFPRVPPDATHVSWNQHSVLDPGGERSTLERRTLDGRWTETAPMPGVGWSWDETDDGFVLYDDSRRDGNRLVEIAPDGSTRTVWDCDAWLAPMDDDLDHCNTNTVNWTPGRDSVLWSTYWGDWIAEIDRASGDVLWHAGMPEGLLVDAEAPLDLQHYPNFGPDGLLMVSTHIPGLDGEQRAKAFEVDAASGTLTEVWSYGTGVTEVWAEYSGEAVRLEGGNTLINYGTGGEIREVDADGVVVWSLQFGDGRTLGHTDLIADLYELNRGR